MFLRWLHRKLNACILSKHLAALYVKGGVSSETRKRQYKHGFAIAAVKVPLSWWKLPYPSEAAAAVCSAVADTFPMVCAKDSVRFSFFSPTELF